MLKILNVSLIALVSGVLGTGIGGLLAVLIKDTSNRLLGVILEFSAGLMMAVVCFELFPQSFQIGGIWNGFIGALIGIFLVVVIDDVVRHTNMVKGNYRDIGLVKTGLLMVIGIALHNFPEGIAVGSGFEASAKLGIVLTMVIGLHDVTEGLAMALPMKAGGVGGFKAFLLTALSGAPMGIGAFIGALLGNISGDFISICLGLAGGAMLYIVSGEILPESKRLYRGRLGSLANVAGMFAGIIISLI